MAGSYLVSRVPKATPPGSKYTVPAAPLSQHDKVWSFHEAALQGSSHYHLPGILRWFTANIGVHHVHHLCSRIPYYRLPEVLRDHPQLAAVGRITLIQSLQCVRMALWDEKKRRLVSFGEADMRRALAVERI